MKLCEGCRKCGFGEEVGQDVTPTGVHLLVMVHLIGAHGMSTV